MQSKNPKGVVGTSSSPCLLYTSGVIGSSQRKALWRGVEDYRGVFAGEPGRAKGYECELKVREHAPYVQRSYPVPYSKRGAVQLELSLIHI